MTPARHRAQLLMMLSEAAEIEHCLMCCYLYAAFSIKQSADEDLSASEFAAVRRWRNEVLGIATDEMLHLALVNNLSIALGGRPHYRRFNFPISPGLFPADVVLELAPFDLETLDHFIYLERPADAAEADGGGFEKLSYRRQGGADRLMPFSDDYATVGELYAAIGASLKLLVEEMGEPSLFVGDRNAQLCLNDFRLANLQTIGTLGEALAGIEFIVRQGEGASESKSGSHFSRYCAIRQEWQGLLALRAGFAPYRSAARNPVMRSPILPARIQVIEEPAILLLDAGNVCYELMLHVLAASAEVRPAANDLQLRGEIARQSLTLMRAVEDVGCLLTTLPANAAHPGVCAGITFTVSRTEITFLTPATDSFALAERFTALAMRLDQLSSPFQQLARYASLIREHAAFWSQRFTVLADRSNAVPAQAEAVPAVPPAAAPSPTPAVPKPAEVVEGQEATLTFDSKRCIHSRHCVLNEPGVFVANKPGEWIYPDAASAERLSMVAQSCPSGAISVRRRDGVSEAVPPVNTMRIREHGPLAFQADLHITGSPAGAAAPYRATLCRCGQSRNKPFCDSSHVESRFAASGEPQTVDSQPLPARNGALRIDPLRNGPLEISGNLEICAGTGRTVDRVTATRLCRCGHSGNKPFCDGSHVMAGFRADGV